MKITKKKTITEVTRYHLTSEVKYDITYVNGKEKNRELVYTGKNLDGYSLRPEYKEDISLLQSWNPFWGTPPGGMEKDGYDWFKNESLPSPHFIDISKIILSQISTHCFFTLDKRPIPVVFRGDYIEARLTDKYYRLKSLHEYLSKNKNVKKISDLLDIPYYNQSCGKKYIEVLVLPTQRFLDSVYESKLRTEDELFSLHWSKSDFLNIKQFQKEEIKDEDDE